MKILKSSLWLKVALATTITVGVNHTNLFAVDNAAAGKDIFTTRCTSCHAVGKEVVGPDLKDVDKRDDIAWIIKFVHSSQTMVKSGDKKAVELFQTHNQTIMPDHPDLSDQDIKNIIAYVQEESIKVDKEPKIAEKPDNGPLYQGEPSFWHQFIYLDLPGKHLPVTTKSYTFWVGLSVMLVLFIGILSYAANSLTFLSKANRKSNSNEDINY